MCVFWGGGWGRASRLLCKRHLFAKDSFFVVFVFLYSFWEGRGGEGRGGRDALLGFHDKIARQSSDDCTPPAMVTVLLGLPVVSELAMGQQQNRTPSEHPNPH